MTPASLRARSLARSASRSAASGWTPMQRERAAGLGDGQPRRSPPAARRGAGPHRRRDQVPEAGRRLVRRAVAGLRIGIRAAGREEQRPVRQERGVLLAGRGSGQATRRGAAGGSTLHSAVRMDLPSGAVVPTDTTRREPSAESSSPESRGAPGRRPSRNGRACRPILARHARPRTPGRAGRRTAAWVSRWGQPPLSPFPRHETVGFQS